MRYMIGGGIGGPTGGAVSSDAGMTAAAMASMKDAEGIKFHKDAST